MERSGLEKKKRLENNSDDTDIDQSTQASLAGFGAGGAFWNKLLESCVCGSGRKEKTSSLPCTHRTQTLRMARHPLAKSSGFRLPEIWNHMHRWCGRFNTQSFMYRKPESSKKVAKVRYQQIIYRTNADIVILPPFCSCPVSPDKWHAICITCIYIVQQIACHLWVCTCLTTSRMIRPRRY